MKETDIKVGMKLIFDPRVLSEDYVSSLGGFRCGFVDGFMEKFVGKIVTISYIDSTFEGYVHIQEDNGRYNYDARFFLTEEECDKLGLKYDKKIEDNEREYTDFKEGDLVKLRDLKTLEKYYNIFDDYIATTHRFEKRYYNKLKDTNAVIKTINKDLKIVQLKFEGKNRETCTVDIDLIEIVEENYLKNKQKRIEKELEKMYKKTEETDDKIIEEMISKVDIKKVKKILASATEKRASDFKGIDKLLQNWAIAKKEIYLLFGKNLKLTKEIEYEKKEADFKEELYELMKKFPYLCLLYSNIGISRFFANRYEKFDSVFEQKGIDIPNGTKLTKAVSEIFKNKELDIEFSKLYENKMTKGIIEVSIDPVDYLTMSFNNSGWHSCYTISEDGNANNMGSFVAGTLSYMCDKTSIIAYKHSENKVKMKLGKSTIEDYSKNWRQVIYLDVLNCTMMCSREYPNSLEFASKTARELIEDSISKTLKIPNNWAKMNCQVKTMQKYMKNIDFYGETLVYNDILHNNRVKGNMIYNKHLNNRKNTDITVGSNVICPYCAEKMLSYSGDILCTNCERVISIIERIAISENFEIGMRYISSIYNGGTNGF